MIVYHGSSVQIPQPDLKHTRRNVDFGPGFYTTTLLEQAEKWAERFKDTGEGAYINRYQLDEKKMKSLKILRFEGYNEDWLDFIVACRRGQDHTDYDIVIGGVANDKVFNTVQLYFKGYVDKNVAIKRLRYEKPNLQICLRTEKALQCLTYEGSTRKGVEEVK